MMTEREAWLWLAEKWDNPVPEPSWGVGVQLDEGVIWCGLCDCLNCFMKGELISEEIADVMLDKIPAHRLTKEEGDSRWAWTTDSVGAKQRAAFCREQAKLLEPTSWTNKKKPSAKRSNKNSAGSRKQPAKPSPARTRKRK